MDNVPPESPREKKGGVAYDIILKAAAGDAPPQRPTSPTKPTGRPLSQEVIEQKLKGAEERRQVSDVRSGFCSS